MDIERIRKISEAKINAGKQVESATGGPLMPDMNKDFSKKELDQIMLNDFLPPNELLDLVSLGVKDINEYEKKIGQKIKEIGLQKSHLSRSEEDKKKYKRTR